jgi:hypothetical protein
MVQINTVATSEVTTLRYVFVMTTMFRALLEKLIVAHLFRKCLTIYGTKMFITVFTIAHYRSLSSVRLHPFYLFKFILILFSRNTWVLQVTSYLQVFRPEL